MPKKNEPRSWRELLGLLLLAVLSPLLLCLIVASLVYGVLLHIVMWLVWCMRGIHVLYVYSNSPNWLEHIEMEVLPRLRHGTIVLNWSDRRSWRFFSLASFVFRHFGGYREFNPMAVVIRPFRLSKVFRFYKAFKDLKHGRAVTLEKMETEFFEKLKR